MIKRTFILRKFLSIPTPVTNIFFSKIFIPNKKLSNLVEPVSSSQDTNGVEETRNKTNIELEYFKNYLLSKPKYAEYFLSNEIMDECRCSKNNLLLDLRALVEAQNSKEFDFWDSINFDDKKYLNDEYTLVELIEIFHLFAECGKKFDTMPGKSTSDIVNELLGKKIQGNNVKELIILFLKAHQSGVKLSFISKRIIYKLFFKYKSMTDTELVMFFYCILLSKKFPNVKELNFKFGLFMAQKIQQIPLEEVGLIALACFRAQVLPGRFFGISLADVISKQIHNCDEKIAVAISKALKLATAFSMNHKIHEFLDNTLPILDRFSTMVCVHIALAGSKIHVGKPEIVKVLLQRADKSMYELRLKELERILLLTVHCNVGLDTIEGFTDKLVKCLESRAEERKQYPECFLSTMVYLLNHEIYHNEFINETLSSEFWAILKRKNRNKNYVELAYIDTCVEISLPNYKGNRIPPELRKKILQVEWFKKIARNSSKTTTMYFCEGLQELLNEMYGENSCGLEQVIPFYMHFYPVICVNEEGVPLIFPDFAKKRFKEVAKVPDDGNFWIVFLPYRWQNCLSDYLTPNLMTRAKVRHFQSLGYSVILADTFRWRKTARDEKVVAIRESISQVVTNKNGPQVVYMKACNIASAYNSNFEESENEEGDLGAAETDFEEKSA